MTSLSALQPGSEISFRRASEEAARYALLRRLAPVIRHNMAGSLQPIAMVAGMLERRLQKHDSDPETLLKNARDIVALSKEAASSCVNLMSWFAPKEDRLVGVDAGIAECLGMMTTELSFRGFSVEHQVGNTDAEVSLSLIRTVFTAALMALTDALSAPHVVRISTTSTDEGVSVHISLQKSQAVSNLPAGKPYRLMGWDDVEALAEAGVRLSCSGDEAALYFELAGQGGGALHGQPTARQA